MARKLTQQEYDDLMSGIPDDIKIDAENEIKTQGFELPDTAGQAGQEAFLGQLGKAVNWGVSVVPKTIGSVAQYGAEKLWSAPKQAWEGITTGDWGKVLTSPFKPLYDIGTDIGQFGVKTAQEASTQAQKALSGVQRMGKGIQEAVDTTPGGFLDVLRQPARTAGAMIEGKKLEKTPEEIKAEQSLKDIWGGGMATLAGGVGTVFSPVTTAIQSAPEQIQQPFQEIGNFLDQSENWIADKMGVTNPDDISILKDTMNNLLMFAPYGSISKATGIGRAATKAAELIKPIAKEAIGKAVPFAETITAKAKQFTELPGVKQTYSALKAYYSPTIETTRYVLDRLNIKPTFDTEGGAFVKATPNLNNYNSSTIKSFQQKIANNNIYGDFGSTIVKENLPKFTTTMNTAIKKVLPKVESGTLFNNESLKSIVSHIDDFTNTLLDDFVNNQGINVGSADRTVVFLKQNTVGLTEPALQSDFTNILSKFKNKVGGNTTIKELSNLLKTVTKELDDPNSIIHQSYSTDLFREFQNSIKQDLIENAGNISPYLGNAFQMANDARGTVANSVESYITKKASSIAADTAQPETAILSVIKEGKIDPKLLQQLGVNNEVISQISAQAASDLFKKSIVKGKFDPQEWIKNVEALQPYKDFLSGKMARQLDITKEIKNRLMFTKGAKERVFYNDFAATYENPTVKNLENLEKKYGITSQEFSALKNIKAEDLPAFMNMEKVATRGIGAGTALERPISEIGNTVNKIFNKVKENYNNLSKEKSQVIKDNVNTVINLSKAKSKLTDFLSKRGISIKKTKEGWTATGKTASANRLLEDPKIQDTIQDIWSKTTNTVGEVDSLRQILFEQLPPFGEKLEFGQSFISQARQELMKAIGDKIDNYRKLNTEIAKSATAIEKYNKIIGRDIKIDPDNVAFIGEELSNLKAGEVASRLAGDASANVMKGFKNILDIHTELTGKDILPKIQQQVSMLNTFKKGYGVTQKRALEGQITGGIEGAIPSLVTGDIRGIASNALRKVSKQANIGSEQIRDAIRYILQRKFQESFKKTKSESTGVHTVGNKAYDLENDVINTPDIPPILEQAGRITGAMMPQMPRVAALYEESEQTKETPITQPNL